MNLTPKEKAVLDLIKQDKSYKNYFFKKVSELKWFDELKKREYFKSYDETKPQEDKNRKGYFFIPQWNVLPYLEKVSQQVTILENERYIDELLNIIKDVTNYHINNNKILDNYRTWWYFVKILCNIPNNKIPMKIIDFIPVWLDSKFSNSLIAEEIISKLLPKFLAGNEKEDLIKAEKIVDFITEIKIISEYTEEQKKEIIEKNKDIFDKPEEQKTEEEKSQIKFIKADLNRKKIITIIETYLLKNYFLNKKFAEKIGEKCSEDILFKIANKINYIFKEIGDYSSVWIKSFFYYGHIYNVGKLFSLILRDMLLAKAKTNFDVTKNIFNEFLSNNFKYPLFKRLVLYVIGMEYNLYRDFFWNIIKNDLNNELFNSPYYKEEVKEILKRNIDKFSIDEKEKIKNIIEEKVPKKQHPEEKNREFHSAYSRQKWYSKLKSDNFFKPLYDKYRNITKVDDDDKDSRDIHVRIGPGPTPLKEEEVLKMSNTKLAEYLKNFKTVNYFEGPTVNALSEILKNVSQQSPDKFIDDLKPFLTTAYIYIYEMLCGIRDAWKERKIIDWGKIFEFIKEYINTNDFWEDRYTLEDDDWKATHFWIIGIISEFIKEANAEDLWAMPENYLQNAQEILFFILDRMFNEYEKIIDGKSHIDDFVSYSLNSPYGKITEALLILALRIKSIEEKTKNKQIKNWDKSIKSKYEEILKKDIVEGYVWLGVYLPNFYYLDKNWTEEKIKIIYNEKKQNWEAFMDGYLSFSRFYDHIYKLMKYHYSKAIDYDFKDSEIKKHLIEHISIAYLRGIENLEEDNSLFRIILNKWDPVQIQQVIDFFWMERDYFIEKEDDETEVPETEEIITIKNRIIEFWRWICNKYKNMQKLNEEDKKIMAELSKLTIYLPEINAENYEWLKLSAQNINCGFESSFFIEYLDKLKEKGKSVEYIGDIFLKILENCLPVFREGNIISIVEFLYKNGKKEEADKICTIYGRSENYFLKEIWNKYNN